MDTKLYCLHIPGPDEVHATPSKEEAERVAAGFNAIMRPALQAEHDKAGQDRKKYMPPIESCLAFVKEWPFSADEHAESLAEWNPADWCAAG